MNRNTLIGLVLGLAAAAVGAVAITQTLTNNNNDQVAQEEQSEESNDNKTDNPFGLELIGVEPPYQITIDAITSEGNSSGTIDVDADNNTRTKIESDQTEEQGEVLLIDKDSYIFSEATDQWTKISLGLPDSSSTFVYSNENYEELAGQEIENKGTDDCAAGTCRIYEITDEDGTVTTLKIDDANNRISELESSDGDDTIKVTYNYDATFESIEAPDDFIELNAPNL